ncbi:UNVERIFIED_CONTAM: putative membrane protein SpoIIM required for sporulation [Acetivibrio alkalicellulosi]
MKEDTFIKQNSETWNKLELLLKKLQSGGKIEKLNKNELDDFINIYNLACGHLSYCRTYYGNTSTTEYLNKLVSSAHSYIYTAKKFSFKDLFNFLLIDFPVLVNNNIKPIMIATGFFMLGTVLSFVLTLISLDNAVAFLPGNLVEDIMERDVNEPLRSWDAAIHSNYILTNNIRVGILVFVMGITLGIGTAIVLVYNGYLVGCLAALYFLKDANLLFWSLILPHGIIELFVIFICGGAGLIIGNSLINPGEYSRKDAFIKKGKIALKLTVGTIPLFIIAGFIEGYITPANSLSPISKMAFALMTLAFIILYITIPNVKYKSKHMENLSFDKIKN